MRIEARFGIILASCFLFGVLVAGYISFTLEFRQAREEVTEKAHVLLSIALSIRNYTGQQIAPIINRLQDGSEFHPEIVPSYGAQTTLRGLKTQFPDYSYHERSLNPTNIADRADDFEVSLLRQFQEDADLKELNGEIGELGQKRFYVSRPLRMTNPACLQCHSTPEAAPKAMVAKYGTGGGFNWKLGDVIGMQIVEVPLRPITERAIKGVVTTVGSLTCVFVLTSAIFLFLLRRYVTRPLKTITEAAHDVSLSSGGKTVETGLELDGQFHDLERAIFRLKKSLNEAIGATRATRPGPDEE